MLEDTNWVGPSVDTHTDEGDEGDEGEQDNQGSSQRACSPLRSSVLERQHSPSIISDSPMSDPSTSSNAHEPTHVGRLSCFGSALLAFDALDNIGMDAPSLSLADSLNPTI